MASQRKRRMPSTTPTAMAWWTTSKHFRTATAMDFSTNGIPIRSRIVIASAALVALIQSSGTSQKATNQFIDDQGVYYAAQGATDLALSEIWGAYKTRQAATPGLDFQTYLNNRFAWETVSPGMDTLA